MPFCVPLRFSSTRALELALANPIRSVVDASEARERDRLIAPEEYSAHRGQFRTRGWHGVCVDSSGSGTRLSDSATSNWTWQQKRQHAPTSWPAISALGSGRRNGRYLVGPRRASPRSTSPSIALKSFTFSPRAVGVGQHADTLACAMQRGSRHGVVQRAGGDREPLGVIDIQQAFWRCRVDHPGQLLAQIQPILNTGVEALPTDRDMHAYGFLTDHNAPFVAPDQDMPTAATGRPRARRRHRSWFVHRHTSREGGHGQLSD
jgi:hypothetical protein